MTAGRYLIIGNLEYAAHSTGTRAAWIRLNGTTRIGSTAFNAAPSPIPTQVIVSTVWELAAGDYVELMAFQNSGSALNTTVQGSAAPEFMLVRLP